MDLSLTRLHHGPRLRGPLAEVAVGGVMALALSGLARHWLGLGYSYVAVVTMLYAVLAVAVLLAWHARAPSTASPGGKPWANMGWANRVTLARSLLIVLIAALVPFPDTVQQHGWTLAGVCLMALALDGVDGKVARVTGTDSAWGARFDMEMDAIFILALSMLMISIGQAGPWVLLLGVMRYAFLGAGQIWLWLQRPLPPSLRRQVVCVWQVGTLLVCLIPLMPALWVTLALLMALLLLLISFAIDVWWLYQHQDETQGDDQHG